MTLLRLVYGRVHKLRILKTVGRELLVKGVAVFFVESYFRRRSNLLSFYTTQYSYQNP